MATSSYAKSLLSGLQSDLRAAMGRAFEYVFDRNLSFGPMDADAAQTATTNFLGRYVKVVTSSVASQEVAIAHGLGRAPNVVWQVGSPKVVNSRFVGDLTFSRVADSDRLYVTSASTAATLFLYVE